MSSPKRKFKHAVPAPRQVGGDDGYQWAVFVHGRMKINGLTRREATHYRNRFEDEELAREEQQTPSQPS